MLLPLATLLSNAFILNTKKQNESDIIIRTNEDTVSQRCNLIQDIQTCQTIFEVLQTLSLLNKVYAQCTLKC